MDIDFIVIYDNTSEARINFVSESVTEALGYEPKELIGLHGYTILHPAELKAVATLHNANVKNQSMSSFSSYRSQHKDGHYVDLDSVVNYCYDCLIVTYFVVVSEDCIRRKIRSSSADAVYIVHSDGSVEISGMWQNVKERIHNTLTYQSAWETDHKVVQTKQEPRFCLFLNRFTKKDIIVFVTRICEQMVGYTQMELIGHSLYDYVDESDKLRVYEQIQQSKSTNTITKFQFKWSDPNSSSIFELEAVISSAMDGLVMVVRLASNDPQQ